MFCIQYTLNEDQSSVLIATAKSIIEPMSPLLLVHGVFGSGKSYLIAVLILFFHKATTLGYLNMDPPLRIIISSNTNVAVDRVLQSVLKCGFTDFVRIGSLKKISKSILPFTVQCKKEDLKDLKDMLKQDSLSQSERKDILNAIKKFKSEQSKNRISKAFLIGVTCLASVFETLNDVSASLVILDECSQVIYIMKTFDIVFHKMTEPTSLLSISRFNPKRLLLVGDPLQLSPTLLQSCKKGVNGLERTLFERLAQDGLSTPILLKTQYRVILFYLFIHSLY